MCRMKLLTSPHRQLHVQEHMDSILILREGGTWNRQRLKARENGLTIGFDIASDWLSIWHN